MPNVYSRTRLGAHVRRRAARAIGRASGTAVPRLSSASAAGTSRSDDDERTRTFPASFAYRRAVPVSMRARRRRRNAPSLRMLQLSPPGTYEPTLPTVSESAEELRSSPPRRLSVCSCTNTGRATNALCVTPALLRRCASSAVGAVVSHDDVDHPRDGVGAVQRRALRPANDFDTLDGIGAQLREEQRIRDLDAVDVDLGIAHLQRARAAQAAILRKETRWRLVPHPHAGNGAVEGLRKCAPVLLCRASCARSMIRTSAVTPRSGAPDRRAGYEHAIENVHFAPALALAVGRRDDGASTTWSAPAIIGDTAAAIEQVAEHSSGRYRIVRDANMPVERQELGGV